VLVLVQKIQLIFPALVTIGEYAILDIGSYHYDEEEDDDGSDYEEKG
jgi:hypothetical protein